MYLSKIQWCDYTHNFWNGCNKVSEGCKFCYEHRIEWQRGNDPNVVHRASDSNFYSPLRVKDSGLVFTCSMSDFFIEQADAWRADAWSVIKQTPHFTYQILTKRPERILECLPADWGTGYKNVWLGVSIESQKRFYRAETLAKIPAVLRFISAEPLLEEVDLLVRDSEGNRAIDAFKWVILGGESGYEHGPYRYRPCKLSWMKRMADDLKEQTEAKVFVKQLGTHLGNIAGMRGMHGDEFSKFPKYLQIREMP
jgi:protein gp37